MLGTVLTDSVRPVARIAEFMTPERKIVKHQTTAETGRPSCHGKKMAQQGLLEDQGQSVSNAADQVQRATEGPMRIGPEKVLMDDLDTGALGPMLETECRP